MLYYIQEFSVAEIGEMLDLPAGTVKSRLFTARRRLRHLLQAADSANTPAAIVDSEPRLLFSSVEGGHG